MAIFFSVSSGSQADPRELDNIVLAYTSDNLVCARIFSKKVLKLLYLRW